MFSTKVLITTFDKINVSDLHRISYQIGTKVSKVHLGKHTNNENQ